MPGFLLATALSLAPLSVIDAPLADAAAPPPVARLDEVDPPPVVLTPEPPAETTPPALDIPPDELVVVAKFRHTQGDPFEAINIKTFEIMQKVDDNVVAPVAGVYDSMPEPVRNGLHNFLKNMNEPVVFVNFVLQHKVGKAAETAARFTLNSVVGVAGLFDMAKRKPFRLPRRPNGFGDTLGFYGVKQGPFLFLPIIGPTTVRDLIGVIADRLVLPVMIGSPFTKPAFTLPLSVISIFDRRSEFDDELKAVRASSNPYATRRDTYLRRRQAEIDALHGNRSKDAPAPARH